MHGTYLLKPSACHTYSVVIIKYIAYAKHDANQARTFLCSLVYIGIYRPMSKNSVLTCEDAQAHLPLSYATLTWLGITPVLKITYN